MIDLLWIFLCLLGWVLGLTIGLPITLLLIFSETFRSSWFSCFYSGFIFPSCMNKVIPARKMAFQLLEDSLRDRKSSEPLEVLEIGVGQGANLGFLPDNCNLTVLDKNKFFERYFRRNAKKYPQISLQRIVIQCAENMVDIEDNSMDVVVTSYFQCSCEDPKAALREIIRVLKPGGKYVCLEHVSYPKKDIGFYLQRFLSPLWYLYGNGCRHRDTSKTIRGAGFSNVVFREYVAHHWWMYLVKHNLVALATK